MKKLLLILLMVTLFGVSALGCQEEGDPFYELSHYQVINQRATAVLLADSSASSVLYMAFDESAGRVFMPRVYRLAFAFDADSLVRLVEKGSQVYLRYRTSDGLVIGFSVNGTPIQLGQSSVHVQRLGYAGYSLVYGVNLYPFVRVGEILR